MGKTTVADLERLSAEVSMNAEFAVAMNDVLALAAEASNCSPDLLAMVRSTTGASSELITRLSSTFNEVNDFVQGMLKRTEK